MLCSIATVQSVTQNDQASSTPAGPLTIPNKLVSYTFDNNSGTTITDSFGNVNATTTTTSLFSTQQSVSGSTSALFTSTGNYPMVNIPYNPFYAIFTPANGVSFSLWVRRTGTIVSDTHVFRWISQNYGSQGGLALLYNASQGYWGFGSVWSNDNTFFVNNNLNTWVHMVLCSTLDRKLTVYINGSIVKNRANADLANIQHTTPSVIPLSTTNTNSDFYIGGFPDYATKTGTGVGFIGFIDDFRAYNKILTQAEVTAIYTNNAA